MPVDFHSKHRPVCLKSPLRHEAFLLAAGHGRRLRPITDRVPKCLVPIQGIPLLAIWLKVCADPGITEVLINLHAHADTVRRFLLGIERCDVRVHVSEEPKLLGSAGTLRANRSWLENEELFWIFYADVVHCADLAGMLRLHRQCKPVATLGVLQPGCIIESLTIPAPLSPGLQPFQPMSISCRRICGGRFPSMGSALEAQPVPKCVNFPFVISCNAAIFFLVCNLSCSAKL